MAEKIRFGIVGAGMIAHFHAKAIADAGGRVVSVMSTGQKRRDEFAEQYKITGYDNLDAFLADPGLDAVAIATPTGAHLEPATKAARAKKHVLCEKPLETTPERARRIIEVCRENGVVLAPIFQYRYSPAAKLVKKALDAGRFGKLLMGNARIKWFRPQSYYDSGAWRGTWDMDGGGCLTNQSIHAIDLFVHFLGRPASVFGYCDTAAHTKIEVEDNAVAAVKFANGALGVIESSTACAPGWPMEIEVSGVRGTATVKAEGISKWDFVDQDPLDAEAGAIMKAPVASAGASDPKAISTAGHQAVIEDMIKTIRTGKSTVIDSASALLPIELIAGIYQSTRTGVPTKLA